MANGKRVLMWVILAIIVIGGGWYLLSHKSNNSTANTIKIGVLTALSGEIAEYGTNSLNGITLAAEEINKNGGINGKQIQIISEDTKCDSATAVSAFNKITGADGVKIILGEMCSGDVQSFMPLANQQGIIVFADGASSPDLSGISDYFSRDYPSDAYEAKVAADTIYNQLHKSKVAILYINYAYGVALKKSFESAFTGLGGKIVAEEGYAQDATDFRTQLSKIEASNPDIVYLVSHPVDGGLATKQARELSIKTPIFGTSGINGNDFIKNAGSSATEGVLIATPASVSSVKRDAFIKNYQTKFGVQPGLISDTGYDSVYILAKAFSGTNSIQEVAANLRKITDFDGVSGKITIGSDGDRTGGNYNVFVVKNGQFVPVQ